MRKLPALVKLGRPILLGTSRKSTIGKVLGLPADQRLEGTLATTNGTYIIDVFSSAQPDDGYSRGEAQLFHRSFAGVTVSNAAPGQNGSASFSIPFASSVNLAGRAITLTATDNAGNTSELSAPVVYTLGGAVFANGFE